MYIASKTNVHIRIAYIFFTLFFSFRKKEEHSNEVKKLNSEKLERDDRIMEQSKEVNFKIFVHFTHIFLCSDTSYNSLLFPLSHITDLET